jgi:hypothetical protein
MRESKLLKQLSLILFQRNLIADFEFLADRSKKLFGTQIFGSEVTTQILWNSEQIPCPVCIPVMPIRITSDIDFQISPLLPLNGIAQILISFPRPFPLDLPLTDCPGRQDQPESTECY